MKYQVEFNVTGRFVVVVEADSVDQAVNRATDRFYEADIPLLDCDGQARDVEDSDGQVTYLI